jgi:hypothetical protein
MIWINHHEAVIVGRDGSGRESVDVLDRGPLETEMRFEARAVAEVANEARVMVAGPAFARTQFERAYVALTRRPDRLVDIESRDRPARLRRPR